MPDPLVFLMGKHPAPLPADARYCKNHMWLRPADAGRLRFGFTAYAVRLMQDVYFLEWKVDEGAAIRHRQEIGFVESSKAQSELYAPLAGTVERFNPELLNDPSGINADPYGDGWLFEMTASDTGTMSAEEYHAFLAGHWEQTQRLLKNQVNADD